MPRHLADLHFVIEECCHLASSGAKNIIALVAYVTSLRFGRIISNINNTKDLFRYSSFAMVSHCELLGLPECSYGELPIEAR